MIRLLAIIIGGISLLMAAPLVVAIVLEDAVTVRAFLAPLAAGLVLALAVIIFTPRASLSLRRRDGLLLVFLAWIFSTIAGAVPFYLAPLNMTISDAIFESSSGFAATGATVFPDIEALPHSILLWRSMNHWAGGMGIVLLTVALMPLLGVGGFQLIKAEIPGPEKDKLTPRIADMAKVLWGAYFILTVILVLLYRLGGMEWFDAVCHCFAIIATGGITNKNDGFAYYNSAFIDWVTTIFMLLGSLNFNLYYKVVRGKFRDFLYDTETRAFFLIFVVAALIMSFSLLHQYGSFKESLRYGSFLAASFLSSTGHARADYTAWPVLAQGVIFCLMLVGGCSGSTSGGIKVIRWTVLFKQAKNEIQRMLYPQGVFSIHINRKVGRKDVVYSIAGFLFLYFTAITVTTLATAASGYDLFSSLTAALSFVGNIGNAFGIAGPGYNFGGFPGHLKLLYALMMLAGRLELWVLFVMFSPDFWKK